MWEKQEIFTHGFCSKFISLNPNFKSNLFTKYLETRLQFKTFNSHNSEIIKQIDLSKFAWQIFSILL